MKTSIICCALMCAVLLSTIDLSASECCHVPLKCTENSKSVERCYDCTEATVYCGVGKCNVLGCACDGGCRQGDSTLWCWNIASGCKGKYFYQRSASIVDNSISSAPKVGVADVVAQLDADNDGQLSLREITPYVTKMGHNVHIESEFAKMDTNGDGLLSYNEIDN